VKPQPAHVGIRRRPSEKSNEQFHLQRKTLRLLQVRQLHVHAVQLLQVPVRQGGWLIRIAISVPRSGAGIGCANAAIFVRALLQPHRSDAASRDAIGQQIGRVGPSRAGRPGRAPSSANRKQTSAQGD